jgi:hypothetical protein
MTVEELRIELEGVVLNLNSSDFSIIDAETVNKLDELAASAGELGMKEGMRLMENLSGTMKAIKDGISQSNSGVVRLTALDFYVKKIAGGAIEDL